MYRIEHAVYVAGFGRVPSIPLTTHTANKQAITFFEACFGETLLVHSRRIDVTHDFQVCATRLIEYR